MAEGVCVVHAMEFEPRLVRCKASNSNLRFQLLLPRKGTFQGRTAGQWPNTPGPQTIWVFSLQEPGFPQMGISEGQGAKGLRPVSGLSPSLPAVSLEEPQFSLGLEAE